MTDPKPFREYSNEEAASIITRVLDRQNGEAGRISHDELLETAREIGVTTLELEAAVVAETRDRAERIVRDEERQRELRKLLRHASTYVVLGAFCFVLDVRITGGVWYFWVLLGWGAIVALHAVKVILPNETDRRLAQNEKKTVEAREGKLQIRP
jgi:2TM domain